MYYHSSFVSRTVAGLSFALLLEPVRYGVPTLDIAYLAALKTSSNQATSSATSFAVA